VWDLPSIIQRSSSIISGTWDPYKSAELWNLPITDKAKRKRKYNRIAADEYQLYAFFDEIDVTGHLEEEESVNLSVRVC
jgi:hypothetical protein